MVVDGCPCCGDTAVRPAELLPRLRHWLVTGTDLRSLRVCVGCGAARGGGVWFSGRRWQWWSRTARVVRTVRQMRTWHPVPVFYIAVSVLGAGLMGTVTWVARAVWPVRWAAAGAIGTPLATFGLSIGTAFRGGGAARKARVALSSRRSGVVDTEEQIRAIRRLAAGRRVLVPARWEAGPVAIGGVGIGDPDGDARLSSLSVVAESGPAPGSNPSIQIEHHWNGLPLHIGRQQVVRTAVHTEDQARHGFHGLDPRRTQDRARMEAILDETRRRQRTREDQLSATWRQGSLVIDGRRVEAQVLEGNGVAAALLADGDTVVTLIGHGVRVEGIELRQTHEIGALLDAKRERETAIGSADRAG